MTKESIKAIILRWFQDQAGYGGPHVGTIDDKYVTLDGDFDLDDLAETIAAPPPIAMKGQE